MQYRLANIEQKLEEIKTSLNGLGYIPKPPIFRSAYRPDEAPAIFKSFGSGYLGYIGDVNLDEETTDVVDTMYNFKTSRRVVAVLGDKTRCRVCLKEGTKKCGNRRDASYCSRKCQTMDWKEHKAACSATG